MKIFFNVFKWIYTTLKTKSFWATLALIFTYDLGSKWAISSGILGEYFSSSTISQSEAVKWREIASKSIVFKENFNDQLLLNERIVTLTRQDRMLLNKMIQYKPLPDD